MPLAFVGSTLTARCGDARVSTPRPAPKSLAAGSIAIFRQALRLLLASRRGRQHLYASPVAADGRIYFISQDGIITVIDAIADNFIILAQNKMGEPTLATPALVGTNILIRTEKALYAPIYAPK